MTISHNAPSQVDSNRVDSNRVDSARADSARVDSNRVDESDPEFSASGYWYGDTAEDRSVAVLNALRSYRAAESAMRQRTRTSMKMGETDLKAIRFLLKAQREGRGVSARELADYLGITTASTSVLINRLVRSKHLERHPHPTDRRGVLITATGGSDDEVRATLAGMHARMIAAAERLDDAEARSVVGFLHEVTAALQPHEGDEA